MQRTILAFTPGMMILLLACTPSIQTDAGQLSLADEAIVDLEAETFLVGTQMCPAYQCTGDACPNGADTETCFAQTIDGAFYDGTCVTFDEPGVVEWSFLAQECPANDQGYFPTDDHLSLNVVAADAVEGRLSMQAEELLEALEGEPTVHLNRPADWRIPDGEPWKIVTGVPFLVSPRLRTVADGAPVAWADGSVVPSTSVALVEDTPGQAQITLMNGTTSVGLDLAIGDEVFPLPTIEGVDRSVITSLELATLTIDSEDTTQSVVYGARAVARNAAGDIILGAPIEWHISELLATPGPAGSLAPGKDYVTFSDVCTDPATTVGEQRATLTATLGLLRATTELVWNPRAEADPREGWTADENCQPPLGPCGCDTGGGGAAGAIAGLIAVLGARRRRVG